jgi:putative transposase
MDWRVRSSRRKAYNKPGHAHELTFTCYHNYPFLAAERTCQWLTDAIDAARTRLHFAVFAYVFMPEHAHVMVYPRDPVYDISAILKAIKQPVGRKAIQFLEEAAPEWLPRISVPCGHGTQRRFWQAGGGYDRNVVEPRTLLAMIEYIHLNPVRRGLVTDPRDWKWSSAGCFAKPGRNCLAPDPLPDGWFAT